MRTIAVRDEVYEALSAMKRRGESFSDVILRLIEGRKRRSLEVLRRYSGSLSGSDLEELVMEERRRLGLREVDL